MPASEPAAFTARCFIRSHPWIRSALARILAARPPGPALGPAVPGPRPGAPSARSVTPYPLPMSDQSNHTPGFLVIISGPSGVGKSTLVNRLLPRIQAELSISKTTRNLRPGDVDGQHYHFVSVEEFQESVAEDDFLEHAAVHGNHYGTPKRFVTDHLAAGRCVVLEIDVNGAAQIREDVPDAFGIFILAPDNPTLLERLRKRAQDDPATIQRRFEQATEEIRAAETTNTYDHFVVNDDFDRALEEIVSVVEAERDRRRGNRASAAAS